MTPLRILCGIIGLYVLLPFIMHAHANFDKALLDVYYKKPWLYKKNSDANNSLKKAEPFSKEHIQKVTTNITISSAGLRLYYKYHVRHTLQKNRWVLPPFMHQFKHNIYFFYDASTIILQTIAIHCLIKGILWYLYP